MSVDDNNNIISSLFSEKLNISTEKKFCSNPSCKQENPRFKCCKDAFYCGKECQVEHSHLHLKNCERFGKVEHIDYSHEFFNAACAYLVTNSHRIIDDYVKKLIQTGKEVKQTAIFIDYKEHESEKKMSILEPWESVESYVIDVSKASKKNFPDLPRVNDGIILFLFFNEKLKLLKAFQYRFEKIHGYKPLDNVSKLNPFQKTLLLPPTTTFFDSKFFMEYCLSFSNWETCVVDISTKKDLFLELLLEDVVSEKEGKKEKD